MNSGKGKRRLTRVIVGLIAVFTALMILELSLRAYKSLTRDGVLHLATPSVNNRLDPRYGWISPKNVTYYKKDPCYGEGVVSYNEEGFRASPKKFARSASPLICILGDSTMQGYQIPDGEHLPHLLTEKIQSQYPDAYVLPLAVGGYGTLQEWLLYRDYCLPLSPDITILHWSPNDPQNNHFLADRYHGPNNIRPRPYLEDGRILIRRPYPLSFTDRLDELLIMKTLNVAAWRFSSRSAESLRGYEEEGWDVTDKLLERISSHAKIKIALVESQQVRAKNLLRYHGFLLAEYDPIPKSATCLPLDSHPNRDGHVLMLNALLPVLTKALADSAPSSTKQLQIVSSRSVQEAR